MYEIHLTTLGCAVSKLREVAQEMGGEPNVIQLATKDVHPMINFRVVPESDLEALIFAAGVTTVVLGQELSVDRLKVEASFDQPGAMEPLYYEAHWVADRPIPPGKHYAVSESLIKQRFYATARIYDPIDIIVAQRRFEEVMPTVPILNAHTERVLIDSNPELDAEWVKHLRQLAVSP